MSSGAENGDRTRDLVITNDVLCQLSYLGFTSTNVVKRNRFNSIAFFSLCSK